MDMYFQASIRDLLAKTDKLSCDTHGFIQCLHISWIDNLREEYERHCRKHGIRAKKKASSVPPLSGRSSQSQSE